MSRIRDAKIKPKPIKVNEIKHMNTIASITGIIQRILKPSNVLSAKINSPCIIETVEPPAVVPKTIESRDTGATITSFRNPNSLSQSTEMPANIELKSKVMPIIPGVRKAT